jgi:hypothetical protein
MISTPLSLSFIYHFPNPFSKTPWFADRVPKASSSNWFHATKTEHSHRRLFYKVHGVSWKVFRDIADERHGSVFRVDKSEDGASSFVRTSTRLHGVTSQDRALFIVTAVRTGTTVRGESSSASVGHNQNTFWSPQHHRSTYRNRQYLKKHERKRNSVWVSVTASVA